MRQRRPSDNHQNPGRLWRLRILAGLAVLAATSGVALATASPAYGHAKLISSTPADGEHLDAAPAQVRLRFDEEVVLVGEGVRLLDMGGTVRGDDAATNPADPAEVVLAVPTGLDDGVYRVTWRVASDDSHPVEGAFVFSTGRARAGPLGGSGATDSTDTTVAVVYWVSRWTGYAGLALLAGGVIFLTLCWGSGWSDPRARRILSAGWLTSVIAAVAGLLLQGPYAAGRPLSAVADLDLLAAVAGSDFGQFVLARLALLAIGAVLLFQLTHRARHRVGELSALVVLGLAVPATWTGTGHANAAGSLLSVLVNFAHLIAMAAWLGGMLFLMAAVLTHSPARPLAQVIEVENRFSRLAAIALGTLVVSGSYTAWRGLGSLAALPGSAYGTLLLFKLAALGLLLWLGMWSRSAVRRRSAVPRQQSAFARARPASRTGQEELVTRAQLRRSIQIEMALGAVILALTSALAATSRPAAAPTPPAATQQNR